MRLTEFKPWSRILALGAGCLCIALAGASAAKAAVYVANMSGQTVSQFDSVSDALTPLSPASVAFSGSYTPTAIAVSPDGRSAYVVGPNPTGVLAPVEFFQYSVAPDGRLVPKSPATVTVPTTRYGAHEIVVTPDGNYVYVGLDDGGALGFAIGANGTLSPLPQGEVFTGVRSISSMLVSPDGRSLIFGGFVGVDTSGNPASQVVQFSIQNGTGTCSTPTEGSASPLTPRKASPKGSARPPTRPSRLTGSTCTRSIRRAISRSSRSAPMARSCHPRRHG